MTRLLAFLLFAVDVGLAWVLWTRVRRQLFRRKPSPPPAPSPSPDWKPDWDPGYAKLREVVAVHEAGHAVAAWHCTSVGEVYAVSIDHVGGDTNGHVVFRHIATPTPPILWCAIVVDLCGIAAEMMCYRRTRSLSASRDLLSAREAARKLVELDATVAPWPAQVAPPIMFQRAFAESLSDAERDVLDKAYAMARWLIRQRREAHAALAARLLVDREVHGDRLAELLGPRPLAAMGVRILAALGADVPARFVL